MTVFQTRLAAVVVGGLLASAVNVAASPSALGSGGALRVAAAVSATVAAVDVDPVQGSSSAPEKFPSPDLPDGAEDLPAGDGSAVATPGWSDVGEVPIEVRAADEVTVLPLDPTEGATTEELPEGADRDVPVAVSVAPSRDDQSPGLIIDVEPAPGGSVSEDSGAAGGPSPAPGPTDGPTTDSTFGLTPSNGRAFSARVAEDPSANDSATAESSSASGQAVDLRISYEDFRYAFGGDWGSRLRVIAYPACFKTTPEVAECSQGVVLPSVNDVAKQTLTFTSVDLAGTEASSSGGADAQSSPSNAASPSDGVSSSPGGSALSSSPAARSSLGGFSLHGGRMAPMGFSHASAATLRALKDMVSPNVVRAGTTSGGTTYVVSASPAGSSGNYGAEPTKPSASWQVGQGSGDFSYAYPFALPAPAVGGSTPDLSASYSSGSVDGMNMAENGQASMMGLGWSLSSSYITRDFANCLDDGHTGFADLCWKSVNGALFTEYTIVLNGHSTTIVRDASDGTLRLRDDPGWTVQKVAGDGSNTSLPNNADTGDEAIKVMDPAGTTYWFGFGWGSDSVLTVPVFGDDPGEPCYDASDIHTSWCRQGWRWGLDKVVDRKGNVTLYDYARVQNYYGRFNQSGTANRTSYDRDGYVTTIRYGFSRGSSSDPNTGADYTKVNLDVRARCVDALTNANETCTGTKAPSSDPSGWPDVPTDQLCTSTQTSCTNFAPSFFSTARYDAIRTQRVKGTSIYNVDKYQLTFALPDDPDNPGNRSLWLSKIQRTGQDPATIDITLPSVGFNGVWLRNRVDPAPGTSTFQKLRIDSVRTETGGRIDVTYGHDTDRDCTSTNVDGLPRYQSVNGARECYPRLLPQTDKWGWWHKYVVTRVALGDDATGYRLGQAPTDAPISAGRLRVYDYEYLGAPGWRYRSSLLTDNKAETWDDWRGYKRVVTHTRRVGADQAVDSPVVDVARHETTVFRGLDNTKLNDQPGVFRSESITTSSGEYLDSEWRNGRVAETVERDNDDQALARVAHEYASFKTADSSTTPDAYYTYESSRAETPRSGGDQQTTTWTVDDGGGDHHGKLLGAVRTAVNDGGTPTDASDDFATCNFWLTSATTALTVPEKVLTKRGGCQSGATILSRTDYYYDGDQTGGAAPTAGDRNYTTVYANDAVASAITTSTKWDVYGRPTTSRVPTSGLPGGAIDSAPYTRIYYNNADGDENAFLTSIQTKTPAPNATTAGFVSTQTLSRTRGLVTMTTDPNNALTTIDRDALGRPTAVWLPGRAKGSTTKASTAYTYTDSASEAGRVTADVARSGDTTDRTLTFYDGWGRPFQTSTLNARGGTTPRIATIDAYDERGQVWFSTPGFAIASSSTAVIPTSTAGIGSYITTSYDALGRPTKVNDKSNGAVIRSTATTYGARYDSVAILNPAGTAVATTRSVYNPRLEVANVTQYANGTAPSTALDDGYAAYTYTTTGQLDTISTPSSSGDRTSGLVTYDYDYDRLGRKLKAVDPDTGTTNYSYDERGNLIAVDDAMANDVTPGTAGGIIRTTYDALDRPTARTQKTTANAAYPIADWTYDDSTIPNGRGRAAATVSHTSEGDFTTKVDRYDLRGNPVSVTQSYPAALTGEQATAGTAVSKTTSQTYNELGEAVTTTLPSVPGLSAALTTTNQYGPHGIFTGMTAATTDGTRTIAAATYDDLNRPTEVTSTSPAGATDPLQMKRAYTWTPDGQLDTLAASALNGTSTYDQLKYDYTYDTLGNPLKIAGRRQDTPASAVSYGGWCYSYDGISRLTAAKTATASADSSGNPATSCATPTTTEAAAAIKVVAGDNYDLTYSYAQARLKTVTAATGSATSVSTLNYPTSGAHFHAPDTVTRTGAGTNGLPDPGSMTYDAAGRVTAQAPPTSATSTPPAATSTYDAQGNLAHFVDPADSSREVSNLYDADGIRVARITSTGTVVYLGGIDITKPKDSNQAATSRRTFTAPGGTPLAQQAATDSGEVWTWLFSDAAHSLKMAKKASGTSADGATSGFYAYYPFGDPISPRATLPGEHGYLNKPHDPDGTIRLDHRSYDSSQAVFSAPDPLMDPENPQTLNAYSYSLNNPTGLSDPSGLRPPDLGGGAPCSTTTQNCGQKGDGKSDGYVNNPDPPEPWVEEPDLSPGVAYQVARDTQDGLDRGMEYDKARHWALSQAAMYEFSTYGTRTAADVICWRYGCPSEGITAKKLFDAASVLSLLVTGPAGLGVRGIGLRIAGRGAAAKGAASLADEAAGLLGGPTDVVVLGRQADTAVAKGWKGHVMLDTPKWSLELNDAFINGAIQQRRMIYLASPTKGNLIQTSGAYAGQPTIYARELQMLREAGYTRSGNYMVPK